MLGTDALRVGAIGYWSDTAKFLLNNGAAVVPSVVFGAPNFFLYFKRQVS
ncbi:hypothetical protein ANAPC1_00983 [Anaplasma phagocytophilum]|uniref:Uncharacterized protein n=1 Tax=Anaplasma phagocytophilum TaxID=948 RepID=A0AA45ZHS5_ANAPH|nr:hypothetical protein ANAPC1_00983 [Anaplasma phagocytophilum]